MSESPNGKAAEVAEIAAEKVLAEKSSPSSPSTADVKQAKSALDDATTSDSSKDHQPRARASSRSETRAGLVSPPFKCNFELTADAVEVAKLEETAEKIQKLMRDQHRDRPGYFAGRRRASNVEGENRERTASTGNKSANGESKSPQRVRDHDRPGFFVARTRNAQRQQAQAQVGGISSPESKTSGDAANNSQSGKQRSNNNQRRRGNAGKNKNSGGGVAVPLKVVVG